MEQAGADGGAEEIPPVTTDDAKEPYRHSVDLRFTTPGWLGRFYFDLRMGHDQRGGTRPYAVPVDVTRRNRVIATVLAQMLISWVAILGLIFMWLFQMGCGAGLGPDMPGRAGGPSAAGTGGTGAISVQVAWPEASAEMIPSAAHSVKLVVTRKDGGEQLGETVIPHGTETATLSDLPAGVVCVVTATAHPNPDGTGTAQAQAVQEVTIPDGSDVPVSFSLASRISTVELAQTELSGQVGGTAPITATAKDESGSAILVESTWTYLSSNPGVACVDPSGVVTYITPGTVTITVTEEESGRSAVVTVDCSAPPPLFTDGPSFPRIANVYGSNLLWWRWTDSYRAGWSSHGEYWSKVDLFVGCGYGFHYDFAPNPTRDGYIPRLQSNVAQLHSVNPSAKVLSYVMTFESKESSTEVQDDWWVRDAYGNKVLSNGTLDWFKVDPNQPGAADYLASHIASEIFDTVGVDGVFTDDETWAPGSGTDAVNSTLRSAYPDKIYLCNRWNLPTEGYDRFNGMLAEDEIKRVYQDKPGYTFDSFMDKYLTWSSGAGGAGRTPLTTVVSAYPSSPYAYDVPGWSTAWAEATAGMDDAQKEEFKAAYKDNDPQFFRFALTTTLLGNGYFAYDFGIQRGSWWWFQEYDAPLGYPTGNCTQPGDGTRRREYQGGTVVVNPTGAPITVTFPSPRKDASTGTVASQFDIPSRDGRILLYSAS